MIKFNANTHYYTRDGKPAYDSTLREARKQFLYPSVTEIDKSTFTNEQLLRWKMDELVNAAAENFRQPHESPEEYGNRIYQISLEKSITAANFGKEIHDAIEHYPQMPLNVELHPWLDRFGGWYNANVEERISSERILLDHDLGVAGRCDTIALRKGNVIIPDYKTQNVKKDKKGNKVPAFYDSWPRQLAFYAVAYAKEAGTFPDIPSCISVVIDSSEPCDPFVREWKREEIIDCYKDFVAGAYLWFSKRAYWPHAQPFTLNPSVPMPI